MSLISILPADQIVVIDGSVAFPVDMTGIPSDVQAVQWFGTEGYVEYVFDATTGSKLPNEAITSLAPYEAQVTEAEAIIYAINNPVTFYVTAQSIVYSGNTYVFAQPVVISTPDPIQPADTTALVPPVPANGQTLQWDGDSWVVASFDITLSLPQAKTSLIKDVTSNGAAAVNAEVSLYSTVQQIEAPAVSSLDAKTYPGTTIGEYQTYIDGQVAAATATINAASTVASLYSFNPADIPYVPASTGIIATGRGGGLGGLDMNPSTIVEWNSTTVDVTDTELFAPATSMVMPFMPGVYNYDSLGNSFTPGNFTVQLRQASTGFVLAEWECPLSPTNINVTF